MSSIACSLFVPCISVSISGIDCFALSGFKNLAKLKLNFNGSTCVILSTYDTRLPPADPLESASIISFALNRQQI